MSRAEKSSRNASGKSSDTLSWKIEDDVPLAPKTTLRVGGAARHFATCAHVSEVRQTISETRRMGLPCFVLGGGSNLLVADAGFDGLVLNLTDESLDFARLDDGSVQVRAGAGLRWDPLVARCVDEGLAGFECLSGIPGRVGAAPIQNIGAYGQEVADTVTSVDVLDLLTGESTTIPAADCGLAYRWSHFKGPWRGRYAVLGVTFRLRSDDRGTVRYPDLQKKLGLSDGSAAPSLADVRDAVLDVRRAKSMVVDPGICDPADPNRRSAGSFFVNPIVDAEAADAVRKKARELTDDEVPAWPLGAAGVGAARVELKLSAAWLMEAAGFTKGLRRGRAGLSTNHALALANLGGARAADLLALAAEIRAGVRDTFGVALDPEPVFLGFGQRSSAEILDEIANS